MAPRDSERPYCFGTLDNVFPLGKDGLRHTPESCMPCRCKTECLRKAMAGTGGITVREEALDRAYESGMIGFFRRWSQKKVLQRQKKTRQEET